MNSETASRTPEEIIQQEEQRTLCSERQFWEDMLSGIEQQRAGLLAQAKAIRRKLAKIPSS